MSALFEMFKLNSTVSLIEANTNLYSSVEYRWLAISVFVLILLSAGCTSLDRYKAAMLVRSGDNAQAAELYRKQAEQGDKVAQYQLGELYIKGIDGKPDHVTGYKWLQKSAEQGYTKAQSVLGYYYMKYDKNYTEALKWYRLAAKNPDEPFGRRAAINIGYLYNDGLGVKADPVEAARWVKLAADHKSVNAQYLIGTLYFDGTGVPKDINEAIKYLSEAAKQHNSLAQYYLIFIYAEGIHTKADSREAAYWITGKHFSDKGEADYYLGRFYESGFWVGDNEMRVLAWKYRHQGATDAATKKYLKAIYRKYWADQDRAINWYQAGAEAGFVGAQVNLANIYWNQNSIYWNCAKAVRWTKAAADKADRTALFNLGLFYSQGLDRHLVGIGIEYKQVGDMLEIVKIVPDSPAERSGLKVNDQIVRVNDVETSKLGLNGFKQLILNKDKPQTMIIRRAGEAKPITVTVVPQALIMKCPGSEGMDMKADPAEAVKWFQKASDLGDLTALFYVARAYQEGKGVPQDYAKALELFHQGADRGDWESAQQISNMYAIGQGVTANKSESEEWFRKAVQLKHRSLGN